MIGKPKSFKLWQEIALTLTLKGALLVVIWFVWFSSPADRTLNDQKVASQILSQQTQKENVHDTVPRTR